MAAVLLAAVLAVGLFLLGRVTAGSDDKGTGDYLAGLRQGESRGVQEGRALQGTESLPATTRDAARAAFQMGYAAGANDAFDGFDGGWDVSKPYVVTLVRGKGPITYDIGSRTLLHDGVDYYVCPGKHTVCQRPHR
jgi:hypothetical protein